MRETDYAYSVGVIRYRETYLISKSDMDALVDMPDIESSLPFLDSKGYKDISLENLNAYLNQKSKEVWDFLVETVPNSTVFSFYLLKNDFHNLKVSLKSKVLGVETRDFLQPSCISPEFLKERVDEKDFDNLSYGLKECAIEAYDILVRTKDGFLCDLVVDRHCLDAVLKEVQKTRNEFLISYANTFASFSTIKTAYRLAGGRRDKEIINMAVCHVSEPDRVELVEACAKSKEALISYLKSTKFNDIAKYLEKSVVVYEKECDERLIGMCMDVKDRVLGPEPIFAYYMAKEMEIANIRIILYCMRNGIDKETIRERVRNIYV